MNSDELLYRIGYGPDNPAPAFAYDVANYFAKLIQQGQMTEDQAIIDLRSQIEGRAAGTMGQVFPPEATTTTSGPTEPTTTEQDTAPGGPIYEALKRYLGYTDEDLVDYDRLELLDLYAAGQEVGLIPKPPTTGTGTLAANLTAQALLNPELIDLTPQGLPGRAILRGTDQIIDLRQPGQYKPISGVPNVYYDSVTGQILDREGNIIRREELGLARENLALQTELGRGNLAVSQGNLALDEQAQGFKQQYEFPEGQRQFNVGTTRDYDLSGDTNRRLAASDILNNAVTLQGQQDQRGFTAARLAADPGNFVEREYVSRGLAAPQQGQAPLFRDVPQVQQGFSSLTNYRPTPAPTLSATIPGTVLPITKPPLLVKPPTPLVQPVIQPTPEPEPYQYNTPGNVYAQTQEEQVASHQASLSEAATQLAAAGDTNVEDWEKVAQEYQNRGYDIPGFAYGGVSRASQMIVGDSQRNGKPNPELVQVPPGTPTRVTPLSKVASQATAHANPMSAVRHDMPMSRGVGPRVMSSMMPKHNRQPIPKYAYGTDAFNYGDYTQQFSDLFGKTATGQGEIPTTGTVSQANPNPTVPINTDESTQQLPTLQYLKGAMDKGSYGNLSTGTTQGAFGTQLPEAGAINFSKIMQIAQDPVALKLLDSLYRSASRSLSAEVERARARAPIGSAPVSSLVRT